MVDKLGTAQVNGNIWFKLAPPLEAIELSDSRSTVLLSSSLKIYHFVGLEGTTKSSDKSSVNRLLKVSLLRLGLLKTVVPLRLSLCARTFRRVRKF